MTARPLDLVDATADGIRLRCTVEEFGHREAARKNLARDKFGKAHVAVVSFDAVTDPGEIALDLITLVS